MRDPRQVEGAAEALEAARPAVQTGLSALMTVLGLGTVVGWAPVGGSPAAGRSQQCGGRPEDQG